jgi:hypothetical protein
MGVEQANNVSELVSGISNLAKNITGNTCIYCGETFTPYKKMMNCVINVVIIMVNFV